MGDLWAQERADRLSQAKPLADRMRPATLEEVVGQDAVVGPETLLRRMILADRMGSVLLWGPPGTGKTTIASLIANHTGRPFVSANASMIGVREIREIIDTSRRQLEVGKPGTILFLDEIHRFTSNQQDVLLGDVERGVLTLVGATTENPWYAVNAALASRSTVFRLESLKEADIIKILKRAIQEDSIIKSRQPVIEDEALTQWAKLSDGDVRRALNALEIAVLGHDQAGPAMIGPNEAQQSIQSKALRYDRAGDAHYDHISALIKSIRGSDPDAAIHWLAAMLASGEDPRFICRRLAILASEDIGLASPQALQMASAAWLITERVGMPECQLTLSELVIYLATCPKSNACAQAIWTAMADAQEGRSIPVPEHLRSGKDLSQNVPDAAYINPHHDPEASQTQDYLGVPKVYYQPGLDGFESEISRRLQEDPPCDPA
ncbi:MAG: replication-associated recombination protein A [Phycisphaerales bacterium]|nr:replication-associated recombination protein A [Phycisphaerales bacterium]